MSNLKMKMPKLMRNNDDNIFMNSLYLMVGMVMG